MSHPMGSPYRLSRPCGAIPRVRRLTSCVAFSPSRGVPLRVVGPYGGSAVGGFVQARAFRPFEEQKFVFLRQETVVCFASKHAPLLGNLKDRVPTCCSSSAGKRLTAPTSTGRSGVASTTRQAHTTTAGITSGTPVCRSRTVDPSPMSAHYRPRFVAPIREIDPPPWQGPAAKTSAGYRQ